MGVSNTSKSGNVSFAEYTSDNRRLATDPKYNKYGWNVDIKLDWAYAFKKIWDYQYERLTETVYKYPDESDVRETSICYCEMHSLAWRFIVCMPQWSSGRMTEIIVKYFELSKQYGYMDFNIPKLCEYAELIDQKIMQAKIDKITMSNGIPYFIHLSIFDKLYDLVPNKKQLTKYYGHLIYTHKHYYQLFDNNYNKKYRYLSSCIPSDSINIPDDISVEPFVLFHGIPDGMAKTEIAGLLEKLK
jgi:hypothetical protein